MKTLVLCGSLLAASVLAAGEAMGETMSENGQDHAKRAEVVLWEGVSAVYHFVADPYSPFRAELAGDFHGGVQEFEDSLEALKRDWRLNETDPERLAVLEQDWAKLKFAGAQILKAGKSGACCTSFQLSRLREMASHVEEDLERVRARMSSDRWE